jgi:hypothetical protein
MIINKYKLIAYLADNIEIDMLLNNYNNYNYLEFLIDDFLKKNGRK